MVTGYVLFLSIGVSLVEVVAGVTRVSSLFGYGEAELVPQLLAG